MVGLDVCLELLDVGGAAALIDVDAVGFIIDDMRLGPQSLKDILGDHPSAAVGAVQGHLHVLVGVGGQADEVADVAVPAGGVVDDPADVCAGGIGQVFLAVEIGLDLVNDLLLHLFAVAVDELDAVVMEGVVAGRDHDAAVKLVHLGDVRHAGRGGDVHQAGVRTGGRDAGSQGALKHIAGPAGVFSDHDLALVVPAVVPAQEAAHLKRVVHGEGHVGLAAKTVRTKIFRHSRSLQIHNS